MMKHSGVIALAVIAAAACTNKFDEGDLGTQSSQAKGEQGDPAGNNGTVKIQEEGATDEIPDNDPHVACKFKIEFRGFDKGDLNATYTLSAQPPSGKFVALTSGEVFIGEDAAGGATDLDATVSIDAASLNLPSLYEHPQQGFHIKLEVHAEGSQGADTKFKVFWISGCGSSPPAEEPPTPPGGTPTW